MSLFVPSSAGAVEQGLEREYDINSGWVTVRRFRGPQADIEAKELEMQFEGYSTRIREGAVWELEARIAQDIRSGGGGTAEQPVDTWELFPNISEKDVLLSTNAAISGIVSQDLMLLREILDGKVDLTQYETASPAFVAAGSGNPLGVFAHIVAGLKSTILYQPILRHTRTVSRAYEIPASVAGAGQVFSSARVVSDNGVPAGIANQMQVSAYSNRTVSGYTLQLYLGWLKVYPTVQMAAYGKTQIVSEWQWGEWSTMFYTINA